MWNEELTDSQTVQLIFLYEDFFASKNKNKNK